MSNRSRRRQQKKVSQSAEKIIPNTGRLKFFSDAQLCSIHDASLQILETIGLSDAPEEAIKLVQKKTRNEELRIENLRQDPDVLDTWFSSWLWPISVFDGIRNPNNDEIKYYYPTSDLITGPDILFFWVARMIFAGHAFRNQKPFENVF